MPMHLRVCEAMPEVLLPAGVQAVWKMDKAYRETTPACERICVNGLWRWQPAEDQPDRVPIANWGYFKAPGCWPGITDYMQKDCQTVYAHPKWADTDLHGMTAAWYQREVRIPREWAGRRISFQTTYLNSYAAVYVDGEKTGEMWFPDGEVDLTPVCRPGDTHVLSLFVLAMPLKGVMRSFSDSASVKEVEGSVARRGLCGDVYLVAVRPGARIADVKVRTSVRNWEIAFEAGLQGLKEGTRYVLRAWVSAGGSEVAEFVSEAFGTADLREGCIAFSRPWRPDRLWDTHTPQNTYQLSLSLSDAGGQTLDKSHPMRFGFREFWIDGRDFFLNGTRIYLSAVPLDNAQVGAALANYSGARESLERLKSFGINFVYTHNYGCQPGSHLSFAEILTAADDVGMLVALSQPHFGHYEWQAEDADQTNGYARHAAFYAGVAQNHPSVVAYSMSHNATGYSEDMNPDMIDGKHDPRDDWARKNAVLALRAEAIVKQLDASRIVYHHSSGNLGTMHTSNFYPNFVPAQELCDWFEHWADQGVKPVFMCEYGAPFTWDWTMYRGWYQGQRSFGSARAPWEFCLAEWSAQFLGDEAFRIGEMEKANLRWEAEQFRAGRLWHRWDYPYRLSSKAFGIRHEIIGMYIADTWRAYRTWGVSATSPWEHGHYWDVREGVDRGVEKLNVDWEDLQRPGFSPDFVEGRYERMDLAFGRSDWTPSAAGQAVLRNNQPLLAYIGGKPDRFTSKDHNVFPGETFEKQMIVVNNSRETVTCDCRWSFDIPAAVTGRKQVRVPTGEQKRVPLQVDLPADLPAGRYELRATAAFSDGTTQTDQFDIHVVSRRPFSKPGCKIALFDPLGETGALLSRMGIAYRPVEANADVSPDQVLVIGKGALSVDGPGPDMSGIHKGMKAILFEQTPEVLEKLLGLRVAAYGLRRGMPRVPDHPILSGLGPGNLRDWRGEATILPSRLAYELRPRHGPTVKWCDIDVTRVWRCGSRGNVASVLIEKPARGDFLPIVDGGYSLQYSPLMEYRHGNGMILFCQMDVTGRSQSDPAADTLVQNIVQYVSTWTPISRRTGVYAGDADGLAYFASAGLFLDAYDGGDLSVDQVLIVGPGGGENLAGNAAAIDRWLKAGGNLLAIGLDEANANAFLPFWIRMRKEEHIGAWFEPFGVDSPLAGIGPADVHNRDPRELHLVCCGASTVGNGVLALAERANAVFCALVPWQFEHTGPLNLKRTFRRVSFLVARILANMGVADLGPLPARIHIPLAPGSPDQRWLDGLYLDRPEEWDDPYRFFRW